jgi:hypothetical protein
MGQKTYKMVPSGSKWGKVEISAYTMKYKKLSAITIFIQISTLTGGGPC